MCNMEKERGGGLCNKGFQFQITSSYFLTRNVDSLTHGWLECVLQHVSKAFRGCYFNSLHGICKKQLLHLIS